MIPTFLVVLFLGVVGISVRRVRFSILDDIGWKLNKFESPYHHTKDTRLQARKQSVIGIYCVLQVYQTKVFVNPSKASRDYGHSTFSACSFFWRTHCYIFCGIRYSKFILLLSYIQLTYIILMRISIIRNGIMVVDGPNSYRIYAINPDSNTI